MQSALHGYCARSARTRWLGIAHLRLGTYRGHAVFAQLLVVLHDAPSIDQRLHRSSATPMKLSERAQVCCSNYFYIASQIIIAKESFEGTGRMHGSLPHHVLPACHARCVALVSRLVGSLDASRPERLLHLCCTLHTGRECSAQEHSVL